MKNEIVRRTLIVIALIALAFALWRISYALLLAFGATLFALFLRGVARKLREWTGIGERTSLAVVGVGLLVLVAGVALLTGPSIANQFDELGRTLVAGIGDLRARMEQTAWGRPLLETLTREQQAGGLVGIASRVVVGTVDAAFAFVLVFAAGIYLAASPRFYLEGAVRLLPKKRHARAREVLQATGRALWLWMIGQFCIMAAVGVFTAIGLLVAGVPLAIPLGLLAGLLEFIPFLGPFLAAAPILLVALTVDLQTALYAALVLLVVQQVEANVLTPLVERRTVALPPVLLLVGTIASGLLLGVLGLIFAAPLLVVTMVWTKMLYMQDALAEPVQVPGVAGR